MKASSLKKIKGLLGKVFRELQHAGVKDHTIRHRYAEFLVASILADRGHGVQLLDERDNREADIYLPEIRRRIEVKSSKMDKDGWAYASFGSGRQISKRMFDYCVLVTFTHEKERVKDILVFKRSELSEVCKRRKGVARFESTNPCGLMYPCSLRAFRDWVRQEKRETWRIEWKLLRSPRLFRSWRRVGL